MTYNMSCMSSHAMALQPLLLVAQLNSMLHYVVRVPDCACCMHMVLAIAEKSAVACCCDTHAGH